jgi:hypothetical protein
MGVEIKLFEFGAYRLSAKPELPYVLIFPDMSSFSRLKLPSGRNL